MLVDADDSTAAAVRQRRQRIPGADVDRQIKKLGQSLWEELVPPELKQIYAKERTNWCSHSLLVYSDEPHLPWELIWPFDDAQGEWSDDGPWCHSVHMTRWLRKSDGGAGNEMARARLALQPMAVFAPRYVSLHNLPMAGAERDAILGLLRRNNFGDVGPDEPTWRNVMDFLEGGGYSWLHFAAHGNFYAEAPEGDSAIWLQEDRALTPQDLTGPEIIRHFGQQHPAIFLNACEVGRQGWGLTRIGGWASRLVGLGAGLFVAPLWTVKDDTALTFANAFYSELLDGNTVASATHVARTAAREIGDPTWLAYSVYGHPNARIVTHAAD